ncbi:TPA: hypothetical protein ACTUO9_002016 [Legionella anisa]
MDDLNKTYYHVAQLLLEPGSIILPGNFGRIINLMGINHTLYSREMLLEYVRVKDFNDKPSRLSSCFVLSNIEDAKFYLQYNAPTSVIYEVTVIDKAAKYHIGCFNTLPAIGHMCKGVQGNPESISHDYWQGKKYTVTNYEQLNCHELVVESSIKIISKIE